jgi:hypothetical protein
MNGISKQASATSSRRSDGLPRDETSPDLRSEEYSDSLAALTRRPRRTATHMHVCMNSRLGAGLFLILTLTAGCSSSIYGWHVRTDSSPPTPVFTQAVIRHEPVAIFGALAQPGLMGTEIGIEAILAQVLTKVAPQIAVIPPKDAFTQINRKGLADEYTRMRNDALQSTILSREPLRKLGAAVGARYIFQPRLTAFSQFMTNRWSFTDIRLAQTRSSIMRLCLQLWDAETGELLWASLAESAMENEAVGQEPVYFQDAVRVTLGSLIADLLNGKTASSYGPFNSLINELIELPQSVQTQEDKPAQPE